MREQDLRRVMAVLGIRALTTSHKGWITAACPFAAWTHPGGIDRHPSFALKVEEGKRSSYVCQSCKRHGIIPSLVRSLEYLRKTSYGDLAQEAMISDVVGFDFTRFEHAVTEEPLPEPLPEEVWYGLYESAWSVPVAREYLEGRSVSAHTSEALGLVYDDEQRRIMFPVRDERGRLFGFSGRGVAEDVKPKVRDYAGLPKRHLILGQERWLREQPVIIVEGLFAYAHLVEVGVEQFASVGALLGSAMTREKADRLNWWGEPVYLLLDNDMAGDIGTFGPFDDAGGRDTASGAVHQLITNLQVYVPNWPADEHGNQKTDPDQLTLHEIEDIMASTPAEVPPRGRIMQLPTKKSTWRKK